MTGGPETRDDPIDLGRVADFVLDQVRVRPALCEVVAGDRIVTLQRRVMQVLVAMAQANGEVVSRDEFANRCWGGLAVGEDALNRCISALRRLIDQSAPAIAIETLPGVGYRLTRLPSRLEAARASVGRRPSVAVLPFANMSGDPEQEYFSDGVSEDVIIDLSKVSSLFVVARHTAFALKGKGVDVRKLASELGVTHVLEGSVRKAGPRVRITAQLVDGESGGPIWADRWDRDLDDIFALQDEISQAIVAALKLKLLPDEKRAIERRGTISPEAYDLYLMARQHFTSGNTGDLRAADTILRLCRRATAIDPDYARAWALMAVAHTQLHFECGKPDDGLAEAERALRLDPNLAEAHAVKARHLFRLGQHDAASTEINLALRLDPESFEVNLSAGLLSFRQHLFAESIRFYEKAASLMEASFGPPGTLIGCYLAIGDKEGAKRAARTCLARVELALTQDRSNGTAMSAGIAALAVLGDRVRARDWIRRALLIDPGNRKMRYNIACSACAFLEDQEGALDLLGPFLASATEGDLAFLRIDPELESLRSDPRLAAMLAAAETRLATDP